jgi:signal peptidase I
MELSSVSPVQLGKEIAESLLRDNIPLKARVGGTSMIPWLKAGDIVTLKKCPPYTIDKGDIVVFRRNEKMVIHRVVALRDTNNGRIFITKGDSCKNTDGEMLPGEFLGKAYAFERNQVTFDLITKKQIRVNLFLARISPYTWPVYYFYFKFRALTNRLSPR